MAVMDASVYIALINSDELKHTSVIELIPVTRPLAEHAANIAADHRIRGFDTFYVALAVQLSEPLITLDRQQLERAPVVVNSHEP